MTLERAKYKSRSRQLEPDHIDQLLAGYFAEHEYMTRAAFQQLCVLISSTASRRLHQLVEVGRLRDISTRHQSFCVSAR